MQLVRQHAQTSRLLGVDFVPAFRTTSDDEDEELDQTPVIDRVIDPVMDPVIEAKPNMLTRSMAHASTTSDDQGQSVTRVEPPTKSAGSASTGEYSGGGYSASSVARLANWHSPSKIAGEDDRTYRTRAMGALRARYEADAPHQQFVTDHHNIVWSDGDVLSKVVFVGEAPGEEEDKTGVPFVGRAGQLLNKMIVAMGLSRDSNAGDKGVYICNVLKTRPPGNATPTSQEAALCEPYLLEQLVLMAPLAIVTLGLPSTRTLLKTDEAMGRLRGRWAELRIPAGAGGDATTIPVMPTYHPAYLLRSYTEENRRKVWQDLQLVMQRLRST